MATLIPPSGTVIISLDDYERLTKYQELYQDLLKLVEDDKATIAISHYGGSFLFGDRYWIKNPSDVITRLQSHLQEVTDKLERVKNQKLPVFNFTGKKVSDL